ncbi:TetR/AcrR family transcriptional regulator [Nocardia jinanensis]|uniref:TetR family transcriptional regulator n=1 Tax=Nocardia jinanensis TaxID=382504 RepID=A0A917RLT1_9NOCA|nr:TetR/AcrR family transcriptional regulator [Nocardia jinanensis]GGL13078.1 TetR family transcriptional regulator [Nocardia jinanensis]
MGSSARTGPETVAGRKGRETRRRILDAVEKRCLEVHHREITVGEIARSAQVSPATFYTYFPDVVAATAEVAQRHLDMFAPVVHAASELADPDVDEQDYQDFVGLFYEFWRGRRGLLETIIASEVEEDPRYFRVLLRLMMSVTYALAPAVRTGHRVGVAGSLVMMLTSSAARIDGFARDGVPFDDLIASQAFILRAALQASAD